MTYVAIILILIFLAFTILMCWQESKRRKIHFLIALLLCLLFTPVIGYFLISSRPLRNPRGCKYCGNMQNEAEYCGVCGKNAAGELRVNA